MDARDKQIALLNINTAAAALTAASRPDTVVDMLDNYDAFFEHLTKTVLGAIVGEGSNVVNVETQLAQAFPGTTAEPSNVIPMPQRQAWSGNGSLRIVGQQHGELPDWLAPAAHAAGVSELFDNRVDRDGNDQRFTKRPWFKEATPKGSTVEPKAFWPPKVVR